jgi:hypothetical protein
MRIGYARVSTADQNPDLQEDALQKAGCERSSAMSPAALSILEEVWLKRLSTPAMETRWSSAARSEQYAVFALFQFGGINPRHCAQCGDIGERLALTARHDRLRHFVTDPQDSSQLLRLRGVDIDQCQFLEEESRHPLELIVCPGRAAFRHVCKDIVPTLPRSRFVQEHLYRMTASTHNLHRIQVRIGAGRRRRGADQNVGGCRR